MEASVPGSVFSAVIRCVDGAPFQTECGMWFSASVAVMRCSAAAYSSDRADPTKVGVRVSSIITDSVLVWSQPR